MSYLDSFTQYYKTRRAMAIKEADRARIKPFKLTYLLEAKLYLELELIEIEKNIQKKHC
jgi:hypothetical protein